MSDEPRHIAIERQLAAEGWVREEEGDPHPKASGPPWRAWVRRDDAAQVTMLVDVPLRPDFVDYGRRCDEVVIAMARARGETWASTLRERDELRRKVERYQWLESHWLRKAREIVEDDGETDVIYVAIDRARFAMVDAHEEKVAAEAERDEALALVAELDELVARLNPLDDLDPEARCPAEVHRWHDVARQAIARHRARQEGRDDD